jgi:hypothetical protein
MNKLINGTASTALALAGNAAARIKDGVDHLPSVVKAIGAGANLVALRKGGKKIAKAVRTNPAATAAAVSVAVGAGVAFWLVKRNKRKTVEGVAGENGAPIHVEPVRMARKRATKATARKARPTAAT